MWEEGQEQSENKGIYRNVNTNKVNNGAYNKNNNKSVKAVH